MVGRKMRPKPLEPRWLDGYEHPGQVVELTSKGGQKVPLVICSSPSESRISSGVANFSVIDVLVESDSVPEDVFHAATDDSFDISCIHGPGFSSPVNEEVKLTSILEVRAPRPHMVVAASSPRAVDEHTG
jgi:hypothetical protein